MPPVLSKLHHIAIDAHHVELVSAFYTQVLGLSVIQTNRYPDETVRSIWLDGGGWILMIEHVRQHQEQLPTGPGVSLLAWTIDMNKKQQWLLHLQAHGIQVTHSTDYTIYFSDPEGNRVALSWWGEKL